MPAGTGTVFDVLIPCAGGVLEGDDVFARLAHIVAEIEIDMELGEEVESIVNLEVAVGAIYVGDIRAALDHAQGIDCAVDIP